MFSAVRVGVAGKFDPWVYLSAAVLASAAEDARAGDLAAAEWLQGEDAGAFAYLAGVDHVSLADMASAWEDRAAGKIVIRLHLELHLEPHLEPHLELHQESQLKGNAMKRVSTEQIQALQAALNVMDPAGCKVWLLEVYDRRNGGDYLREVIDIRTGQPLRGEQLKKANQGIPLKMGRKRKEDHERING